MGSRGIWIILPCELRNFAIRAAEFGKIFRGKLWALLMSSVIFGLLGWTLMLHDDIDRRWRRSRRSWRRRCRASGARSRSWARLWRRSIDGTTSSMTAHENHFSTDSRRSLTSNCSETLRCSPVNSWCVVWWNILRAINLGTTCVENLFSQPVEKWLNYLCSLSFRIGYNAKLISSKLNCTICIDVSNMHRDSCLFFYSVG